MSRKVSLVAVLALAGLALVLAGLGNHQQGDAFARTAQADFWNYDRQTGAKVANMSPGLGPSDLAALYTTKGSRWAGKTDRSNRTQSVLAAVRQAGMPVGFGRPVPPASTPGQRASRAGDRDLKACVPGASYRPGQRIAGIWR